MFYDKNYNRIAHNDKVMLDLSMCDQFEYDEELKCSASYESDTEVVFYDTDGLGYSFTTETDTVQLNCVSIIETIDEDTENIF